MCSKAKLSACAACVMKNLVSRFVPHSFSLEIERKFFFSHDFNAFYRQHGSMKYELLPAQVDVGKNLFLSTVLACAAICLTKSQLGKKINVAIC